MRKLMDRLYDNISEAKAFELSFTNFVYMYDDVIENDFTTEPCKTCDKAVQVKDYLFPRSSCRKPYGILSTLEFGVNQELRDALIENFDITDADFRPIRNKKGDIVYSKSRRSMLCCRSTNSTDGCPILSVGFAVLLSFPPVIMRTRKENSITTSR